MYGKVQNLDSLKSSVWYAPPLSAASMLCFLLLRLLRYIFGGHDSNGRLLDGRHPASTLSFLRGHTQGMAVMWWLDGCDICLLKWQATVSHWHSFILGVMSQIVFVILLCDRSSTDHKWRTLYSRLQIKIILDVQT